MNRERRDVFLALPQRRQLYGKDAQPVVKILAETPFRDLLPEIAIGGRHDPYVNFASRVFTHPLELALLQDSKKLRLMGHWDFSHLVKEERPAVRVLESPGPIAHRACEGTPGMTEEFALEKL
ncbi:MAG TPA: hypothetical protein VLL57_02395 [Candidatus Binataceae bacterium]|nr:hypothetical protein [Candidatus Binataceae bacterium]